MSRRTPLPSDTFLFYEKKVAKSDDKPEKPAKQPKLLDDEDFIATQVRSPPKLLPLKNKQLSRIVSEENLCRQKSLISSPSILGSSPSKLPKMTPAQDPMNISFDVEGIINKLAEDGEEKFIDPAQATQEKKSPEIQLSPVKQLKSNPEMFKISADVVANLKARSDNLREIIVEVQKVNDKIQEFRRAFAALEDEDKTTTTLKPFKF